MSSFADSPRLPVIDLSLFDLGDPWRDQVAAQVHEAATQFGFFHVVGHGVEAAVVDSMLALSQAFFAHDGDARRRVRSARPLHGGGALPEPPGFRDAALDYVAALTGLGHRLMASIGRGMRLGDSYFVDRYTGNPSTLFRIFSYPASSTGAAAGARDVGEHTDQGLLTLLYQSEESGLQFKHRSRWVDVPHVPGSFVVSVGDLLERLTSGRYTCAPQRVVSRSSGLRVSMPFSFDAGFDAQLSPIAGVGSQPARRAAIEEMARVPLDAARERRAQV